MKNLKLFIKPLLILTVLLFLISLLNDNNIMDIMGKIQNNIQEGLRVVKITEEKSEIKDENLDIIFKVPNIHYDDKSIEKKINFYIKNNIREYINVQRQINKINKHENKKTISINYNIVFEDKNIINLIIDKNISFDKNNYKLEKDSYIFSLKTGERIYLDEFLKDNSDYSEVISEYIRKNIDKNHPLYNNLDIDKNTNYYIEDRYINIYFNPYKKSNDNNKYEFKMPYDIFKNKIQVFNCFSFMTIDKEVIKKENKYLKSNLEIPVLKNKNNEIDDKINKKLKEDIMNYYESSLKEAQNYLDDFVLDESNFVADASFEVKKNSQDFISILIKYYKYSGGAHGYYEYVPYNIDLRNGNFISLKDIFKKDIDYKVLINKEIENQIKELIKKEENLKDIYEFYGIKENQKFYLDNNNNLVIYFDLYDIAPYAAGIPEFPISFKNIENQIKNEYINLIN